MEKAKRRKRPNGYWQNQENFERDLREVIKKLGHFPSQRELATLGRLDILSASERHHDGLPAARMRFGFEQKRKLSGYWRDRGNFERELQKVIRTLGHFPSTGELATLGRNDILGASKNYHDGLPAARARMGYGQIRKPSGFWQKWGNLQQELREVIKKLGHFPSTIELAACGRQDVLNASHKHHHGLSAVRERMGHEQNRKPNGYWRDRGNFERELQKVIRTLGHFPSGDELAALGRNDILGASTNYHDGLPAARARMGYEQTRKPLGYWQQRENLERELREVIEKLGHFPNRGDLKTLGRHDIIRASYTHHDSFPAVRVRMGYGLPPRAAAAKLRSLAAIPGLADDEFVAVVQTVPGLEVVSENLILKHRTRLNLGPLELPPSALDGGGVAFWEHCLEELQAKHPAPERLEELWVLERIAARIHRAASIEVLGREPVTAEDEQRVVGFLEKRAQQRLDAAARK